MEYVLATALYNIFPVVFQIIRCALSEHQEI